MSLVSLLILLKSWKFYIITIYLLIQFISPDTWKVFIEDMQQCYLLALQEYTTDSRGDIGAWVREAAMSGLHVLINLILQSGLTSVLNEELMASIVSRIAQQAVERIDKIRAQAGAIFASIIHK